MEKEPKTLALEVAKLLRDKRAEELLDMVGLSARKNSLLGQMSGGEQQRCAIAIALSNNPKLLLADEPTGAVDTKTANNVLDVFKRLNKETGVTVIIVTHDTNLSKSIDRVVAIRDGKTSSELIRRKPVSYEGISFEKLSELQQNEIRAMQENQSHDELIVLDRAGRLQIPRAYLEALGIKGGDKVCVELEEDKISSIHFLYVEKKIIDLGDLSIENVFKIMEKAWE